MNNRFDRIEAHLRALFEENLPQFFTGYPLDHNLVDELLHVMKNNLQMNTESQFIAPDFFILRIPQEELIEWQVHQDILDEIAVSIHQVGIREGFCFQKPPKIELHPELEIPKASYTISAQISPQSPDLPDTAAMSQQEENKPTSGIPENAMLIIGGKTNFLLNSPVINIGRHSENDLILDDLRVSRHHAQLRAIKDNFVIFDVGSTGGLFVNGRRISQATLHAGDVIRIGMVNIIYNQESTNSYTTSVIPVENENDFPGEDEL